MEEQKNVTNMGGSMRLGAYDCVLKKDSKVYAAYGKEHIQERHRHRFEFNNEYKAKFEEAGMKCTGENPETYARMKQKDEYPEITHRNPTAGIYGKQYSYHLPIKQTAPV